jgi:hypothetical protein
MPTQQTITDIKLPELKRILKANGGLLGQVARELNLITPSRFISPRSAMRSRCTPMGTSDSRPEAGRKEKRVTPGTGELKTTDVVFVEDGTHKTGPERTKGGTTNVIDIFSDVDPANVEAVSDLRRILNAQGVPLNITEVSEPSTLFQMSDYILADLICCGLRRIPLTLKAHRKKLF